MLRGSVLIIESIDRLNRNKVGEALQLFISILNSGVSIVTREPRRTDTQDSINDIAALLEPIIYMSRAHEESATKSFRLQRRLGQEEGTRRAGFAHDADGAPLAGTDRAGLPPHSRAGGDGPGDLPHECRWPGRPAHPEPPGRPPGPTSALRRFRPLARLLRPANPVQPGRLRRVPAGHAGRGGAKDRVRRPDQGILSPRGQRGHCSTRCRPG